MLAPGGGVGPDPAPCTFSLFHLARVGMDSGSADLWFWALFKEGLMTRKG